MKLRKSQLLSEEVQNEIMENFERHTAEQEQKSAYERSTNMSRKRVAMSPWISYDLYAYCRTISDANTVRTSSVANEKNIKETKSQSRH